MCAPRVSDCAAYKKITALRSRLNDHTVWAKRVRSKNGVIDRSVPLIRRVMIFARAFVRKSARITLWICVLVGVGAHYVRPSARSSRARRPRGSNSRPGEHEQRRVRVDLAPGALRAHRFVPARRCAPPKLRRGGPAPSPGDARRRRGHGARHRRRAADQGRPRGLSALGMQAQGTVEVRARPPSIRDPRRGLRLFRPPREAFSPGSPVASFRNFATSRPFLGEADKNCPSFLVPRVARPSDARSRRALRTCL